MPAGTPKTPKIRDFRSDTVTLPTQEMRKAMMDAEVGDDILGEDPTVSRLESSSAALLGKQAGLFVISGTMGNQVAIQTLTQRGDEVLVGEETHIFNLEVAGLAALSGVQARPLKSSAGRFDPRQVRSAVRPRGVQSPVSRVLCLENTYDLNRGIPLPPEYAEEMAAVAHDCGMAVYLDGARIFNAAVFFGVAPARLCEQADLVMFCLSKGLAAPVGSLLAGSREIIDRARWVRQRLGGGMRQAGHMAAAGLVALESMRGRLADDHANARRLVEGLAAIDPDLVDLEQPLTNVVRVDFKAVGRTAARMVEELLKRGIKVKPVSETACRMITHWGLTAEDVDEALQVIRSIVRA